VRLYHWLMDTEAWRDLEAIPRCVYIELAKRYAGPGSNNGRIPYSLQELANALHISKQTAMRALDKLADHGFVVCTKPGSFNTKVRHAAEWRLTEFGQDHPSFSVATKDFARWQKSKRGSTTKPEMVSTWNRSGVHAEQSQEETKADGSTSTPKRRIVGSSLEPPVVYQGPRPRSAAPSEDRVRHAAFQTASVPRPVRDPDPLVRRPFAIPRLQRMDVE
jgi:hypothetical protein